MLPSIRPSPFVRPYVCPSVHPSVLRKQRLRLGTHPPLTRSPRSTHTYTNTQREDGAEDMQGLVVTGAGTPFNTQEFAVKEMEWGSAKETSNSGCKLFFMVGHESAVRRCSLKQVVKVGAPGRCEEGAGTAHAELETLGRGERGSGKGRE